MTSIVHLRHPAGLSLSLSSLGAAWLSCRVPMAGGTARDVILQRVEPPDATTRAAYLGATVGRYANRIGHARITRDGQTWQLQPNPGSAHQLHGGPQGFDAREWDVEQSDDVSARFSIVSPDGDQGYPGTLQAQVLVRLAEANSIVTETTATVSAASPVCLTNHAYFNLDGVIGDVRRHALRIAAPHVLPVDRELIPLGPLAEVQGTSFDFRHAKRIERDWLADDQQRQAGGYDHAFLLSPECAGMAHPAVELTASDGALRMRIATSLPSIQFYAGQYLAGVPSPAGGTYPACAAVALEPQFLPDSPNHPEWPQPSCWLLPGEVYRHSMSYVFDVPA